MKLLDSVAVLAILAGASPAFAQDVVQTADETAPTAQQGGLEEIIVTAQRRSENLQRTSVPLNAISSAKLASTVTRADQLTDLVPSATITSGGGGGAVSSIRGVGTLASNGLGEQVVAYNLDGVYLARPIASSGQFYDLERVEVLKGPQGTLYGRNATAGAINIITRKPTFEPSAEFSGQVGNYNLFQGQGAINVPVSETVAIRVAGQGISRSGYLSDGYADQKQYSGRATILAEPTEELTLTLTGDFSHLGGRGVAGVLSPFIRPNNPYFGPSEPEANLPYTSFRIPGLVPNGLPPIKGDGYNDSQLYGVTATIQYDADFGSITVLPAYRRAEVDYRHYSAGFQVDNIEVSNTTSLEVRYATPTTGPFSMVLGGYYFKETGSFELSPFVFGPSGSSPPFPSTAETEYSTRALAVFGQASFSISDTVRLIGGLRYSDEKKDFSGTSRNPFSGARIPYTGKAGFNKLNFRAGVEADITPRNFVFATVATGFKAGGFFSAPGQNSYAPENLTAYSIGSKNRFLDNRVQFNVEGFLWKYKDKQVTHLEGGILRTDNAGAATLYGIEVDMSFLATPDDRISLNALYNNAKYDRFEFPLAKTAAWNCPRTTINPTTDLVSCNGNRILAAPLWTVNAGYERTFRLANEARVVFNAVGRVRSSYWTGDERLVGMKQGSYFQGDLDLTYHAPEDRWRFGAFVRNVTDKAVISSAFVTSVLARPVAALMAPRTYGVSAGVKF